MNALKAAERAILSGDEEKLYEALKAMGLQNLQPQNKGWYLKQLQADRENKEQVGAKSRLGNITLHYFFINSNMPSISSVRFLIPPKAQGQGLNGHCISCTLTRCNTKKYTAK